MLLYVTSVILCVLLWKLMLRLKSSWTSYSAIAKALSNGPLPEEHHWFYGIAHLVSDRSAARFMTLNIHSYKVFMLINLNCT